MSTTHADMGAALPVPILIFAYMHIDLESYPRNP